MNLQRLARASRRYKRARSVFASDPTDRNLAAMERFFWRFCAAYADSQRRPVGLTEIMPALENYVSFFGDSHDLPRV